MPTGAITGYIDVAQLVLYAFWFFFFYLIVYLVREGKREGYPLEPDQTDPKNRILGNFPPIPEPKEFKLMHDRGTVKVPSDERHDTRPIKAEPVAPWSGAPFEPTGNPMLDGFGPAAYADRADVPELTVEGEPRMAPMRKATEFGVDPHDPNPIGMTVVGADGEPAGKIVDAWVDRAECLIRYYEVELPAAGEGAPRRVMLPITFAKVNRKANEVRVKSILAQHFADVPGLKNAEQMTLLEEEKIMAYYGGGTLYALPSRRL